MKLNTIFTKNFIKKFLFKVFIPYVLSFLKRRKFFRIKYKGKEVLLNSVIFDGDIMYHHFHSHYRFKDNFSKDKWEKQSIDLAKDATLYLDIGGYNGVFGLLASKMNKNIKVHIFEPNPLSAYIIYRNMELNKTNNVFLHQVAVGNINKLVPVKIQKNGSRVDFTIKNNFIMLNCITIDSLINSLTYEDFKKVVIKIDAEGFEKQCLEGMKEFISRCKFLDIQLSIHSKIISPIHNYTEADFYKLLKEIGLKIVDSGKYSESVELLVKK